jgi:hypothetical protein
MPFCAVELVGMSYLGPMGTWSLARSRPMAQWLLCAAGVTNLAACADAVGTSTPSITWNHLTCASTPPAGKDVALSGYALSVSLDPGWSVTGNGRGPYGVAISVTSGPTTVVIATDGDPDIAGLSPDALVVRAEHARVTDFPSIQRAHCLIAGEPASVLQEGTRGPSLPSATRLPSAPAPVASEFFIWLLHRGTLLVISVRLHASQVTTIPTDVQHLLGSMRWTS